MPSQQDVPVVLERREWLLPSLLIRTRISCTFLYRQSLVPPSAEADRRSIPPQLRPQAGAYQIASVEVSFRYVNVCALRSDMLELIRFVLRRAYEAPGRSVSSERRHEEASHGHGVMMMCSSSFSYLCKTTSCRLDPSERCEAFAKLGLGLAS